MRLWLKSLVSLGLLCAIAAVAYAELVLDIRSARSSLAMSAKLNGSSTYSIADINRKSEELNQKYGDGAKTVIGSGGKLTTRIGGEVVHEEIMKGTLASVTGIILAGPQQVADPSEFPFDLGSDNDVAFASRGLASSLKHQFAGDLPARFFAFDDSEFAIGDCFGLSASDLGLGPIGQLLRLKNSRSCEVSWKGSRPASMLISLNIADGDPWMRPFSSRICRLIAVAALKKTAVSKLNQPDYASCILADRPDRIGARNSLSLRIYEVGLGGTLLRMGQ
jgi:hypothetical protein